MHLLSFFPIFRFPNHPEAFFHSTWGLLSTQSIKPNFIRSRDLFYPNWGFLPKPGYIHPTWSILPVFKLQAGTSYPTWILASCPNWDKFWVFLSNLILLIQPGVFWGCCVLDSVKADEITHNIVDSQYQGQLVWHIPVHTCEPGCQRLHKKLQLNIVQD